MKTDNWNEIDVDDVVRIIGTEYDGKRGTVIRAAGGDFQVRFTRDGDPIWFHAAEVKLIRKA